MGARRVAGAHRKEQQQVAWKKEQQQGTLREKRSKIGATKRREALGADGGSGWMVRGADGGCGGRRWCCEADGEDGWRPYHAGLAVAAAGGGQGGWWRRRCSQARGELEMNLGF